MNILLVKNVRKVQERNNRTVLQVRARFARNIKQYL